MDDRVLAHPILAGTRLDAMKPLLADVKSRVFAAGETVSRPDTSWPVMQLLLEGRLCLFELTRDGRRIILDHLDQGDVDATSRSRWSAAGWRRWGRP